MYRLCASALMVLVGLSAQPPAAHAQVIIEWVMVADAGNPDDVHGAGHGGVNHEYRIARYEVTNGQYRAFLNAVAASDPNELYYPHMAAQFGGIVRNGTPGSYTYTVKDGDPEWDSRPVNFVDYYDALRFTNWLHNGQPTGVQDASTTEDGAYTFSGPQAAGDRNPSAQVFLPTDDEWYKAAYYKGGGSDAGYWDYATQSDDPPVAEAPPGGVNSANYRMPDDNLPVGPPYYNTPGGAYVLSPGAYGTFDQNGNLWEWNESLYDTERTIRGGSWFSDAWHMSALLRISWPPDDPDSNIGFRVAAPAGLPPVPTVSMWGMLAMLLLVLTVGTLTFRRITKLCPPGAPEGSSKIAP